MYTYKLVNGADGKLVCVQRSDGWSIPVDDRNRHYQEYLKWLEAGNTPEMADNPPQEGGQ